MARNRPGPRLALLVSTVLLTAGLTVSTAEATPTDVPASGTPAIDNGNVNAMTAVDTPEGRVLLVGGTFTSVTPPGATSKPRLGAFAVDADTGEFLPGFNAKLDGTVEDVQPGPTPGTAYIAGKFKYAGATKQNKIALVNARTGELVGGFTPPAVNGKINAVALRGDRVLVGGYFTTANGQTRKSFASYHATTGQLDSYLTLSAAESHNEGAWGGAEGPVGVKDMEVTDDGSKLVAVGNFRKVDGYARDQVVVANLGASAGVAQNWNTTRFNPLCNYKSVAAYVRKVAISPDNSNFVISATGGRREGALCDTATRWEFSAQGQDVQPTWVSQSGGDTLWGLDYTSDAVYVGGHQRWMNNGLEKDRPGPGAVPRPGLAALEPGSGVPLSWNPGRNPRGAGAYGIYADDQGVWIGSDTDFIGDFYYKRPGLAFFPAAGGTPPADRQVPTLPHDVYLLGDDTRTVQFDGTSAGAPITASFDNLPSEQVLGGFKVGSTLFTARNDGMLYHQSATSEDGTPTIGEASVVNPYTDTEWNGIPTGSHGTTYDGILPTFYGQIRNLSGVFYADERVYYTLKGASKMRWRWFSPESGIIGEVEHVVDSTSHSFANAAGMFRSQDRLYVVDRWSGDLTAMTWTSAGPTGRPTRVNDGLDWRDRAMFLGPAHN